MDKRTATIESCKYIIDNLERQMGSRPWDKEMSAMYVAVAFCLNRILDAKRGLANA